MIRKIKAALRFLRDPSWPDCRQWTASDAATLQAFMQTETGVKLGEELRAYILRSHFSAVNASPGSREYECGAAHGKQAAAALLDTLGEPDNFTTAEGSEPAPVDE